MAITIGLMLRSDKLGVTSVIRDLAFSLGCYDSILNFFRASSDIRKRWFLDVKQNSLVYTEGNFHVFVGDEVKQFKEGRRMPGVRKLFQESENPAKPEYIDSHMFILARHPGREHVQLDMHILKHPPSWRPAGCQGMERRERFCRFPCSADGRRCLLCRPYLWWFPVPAR